MICCRASIAGYFFKNEVIMKDIFLFCTCAENNYKFYLARIDIWYKFVQCINADFYVFVDGRIPDEEKQKRPNLKFVEHDRKLGMWNGSNHAGWRRSVCTALKASMDYKYVAHIENDVILFNPKRVEEKILTGKNISGYVEDGDYMETAIMALNDKSVNNEIIKYYSSLDNLFKNEVTERRFQSFTDWKYDFKGSNVGIKGRNMSFDTKIKYLSCLDVDYWGQFFHYGFDFINGRFVWTGKNMV